jgi:hypothetical protein
MFKALSRNTKIGLANSNLSVKSPNKVHILLQNFHDHSANLSFICHYRQGTSFAHKSQEYKVPSMK